MARLMRAHDWTASPLGAPDSWPQALRVALRILLTSRFEMWLGWGPDIAFFYNDAYRPTLGAKHPRSLGMPTQALWPEIWDEVAPRIRRVYDEGVATWDRDLMLLLHRHGYLEETYHTFSYSPLIGDTGKVEGLFCAVSEETDRVISERRMSTLQALAAALAPAATTRTVIEAIQTQVGANTRDAPFSLTYLFDDDGAARLVATTGGIGGHSLAREVIGAAETSAWCVEAMRAGEASATLSLEGAKDLPTGAWDNPAREALVVPLSAPGRERAAGFYVVGLNPHRPLNAEYAGFVQLLAGQISAGLSSAVAFEAERARTSALAEAVQLREAAAETLSRLNQTLAAEVATRTSERDRLRDLFQQAPGFMCVLRGRDLVFELVNTSYLQLIGHRDVVGKSLRDALPEVVGQGYFELLDQVIETGQPFVGRNMRVMLQRQTGADLEERYLHLVYQPIFEADGSVSGVFAEGSDVTDQVRAEAALRQLNETLEARVGQRTEELADALDQLQHEAAERESAQAALRQAQKMEAVGQLTGGIAHDFNNLLTGVLGSLDFLRKRIAQGRLDDVERYAFAAESAAKRAAGLTHRLLAFSRRQPLDPKPLDANQLVQSMEDLVRRTIGETVQLEVVRAAGLWTTLCDPNQLESAILNLAINARDAMPSGGKLVIETCNAYLDAAYVAREHDLRVGQYVCVSVSDTGTGMTADTVAKAFEPFFTTKPIGQGTGLGLSMIYGFTQQSNGYAKIYSEIGQGTTIKLYLPRHYAAVEAEPVERLDLGSPQEAEQGQTVLVVEDEPSVRSLVVELLRERGFSILEASDGPAGLALLESPARIDLLVTDVGLPGLNGRQMADAARNRRPGLPILFMTGYAENAAIANGFLAPGMEMITKPFAMGVFVDRVLAIIEAAA